MRVLAVFAILLTFTGFCHAQEFKDPVRIFAGGEPVDTDIGHAAPYMYDFDGDGVRDLLVGQFGQGILTIYRNTGTNSTPEFAAGFEFMEGSEDGRVPTG
ncbi:MAG: hypothetical protein AAF456_06125 [Planctomycetota bacterium]